MTNLPKRIRALKRIRVGSNVEGIQGIDGGYQGTVTSVTKDRRGKVLVTFIDTNGKTRETFDFNVKIL